MVLNKPVTLSVQIFLCFILVLISFSEKAEAGKKITIATSNFPPFEYEEKGKTVGFDTEIIEQVLIRMGYEPEFKILPWSRALKYVKDGKVAGIYSLTKNPEREGFCYFSDPLCTVRDVFFKLKTKNITWKSISDMIPFKVGISRGYSYAPVFMKVADAGLFKEVSVISGDDLERRQLKKVKSGYIDVCICEVSVCQYLIKKHAPEFDMIDYIDKPIGEIRPYFIGFSKKWKGSEKLSKEFNAELKVFVKEGKRDAIFKKYNIANPFAK